MGTCKVSLKEFINEINSFHPTIKFTADWSKEKVNVLDVEVTLNNGVLSTDLIVKPLIVKTLTSF